MTDQPQTTKPNIEELLTTVVKQLSDKQTETDKTLKSILAKLEDKNPVAHGGTLEIMPKVQDGNDAGAPVTATNRYGQSLQASIIAPAVNTPATDEAGLSMEEAKKADVKKEKEEKTKETEGEDNENKRKVNREVEEDLKPTEKSTVKKTFEYVKVEPVRPEIFSKLMESYNPNVTGYQILKAIETGWDGKYTSADASLEEAIARLNRGEFGTGSPGVY